MKAFTTTLLLLGGAFLAYDYFLAPADQKLVFVPMEGVPEDWQAPSTDPVATMTPAEAPPAPEMELTEASTETFVPPEIASVEEVTQNWTLIPERAFPRNVVLKKAVPIQMSVGSGTLASGATALALDAKDGLMTVAPSEGSTARGTVAVTDTDFPDQIQSAYATWKAHRIDIARKNWEAQQARIQQYGTALGIDLTKALDPSGKPVQNSDGSYDLLLASIRSGQVTDIDPDEITGWSSARPGPVGGGTGWVVDVNYVSQTLFGPLPTVARAEIQDKKVVRWFYPGSGMEVE